MSYRDPQLGEPLVSSSVIFKVFDLGKKKKSPLRGENTPKKFHRFAEKIYQKTSKIVVSRRHNQKLRWIKLMLAFSPPQARKFWVLARPLSIFPLVLLLFGTQNLGGYFWYPNLNGYFLVPKFSAGYFFLPKFSAGYFFLPKISAADRFG